jgi:beta-phosphoglucomutase
MTADNFTLPAAVIFDVDGVLVDSSPFHLRKWMDLLRARAIPFSERDLPKIVLGPANDVIFRHFLGADLTREALMELGEELDANFRREIGPQPPPLPGVLRLIEECHARSIPMAVASAAIASNVTFLVSALGLRHYFREVLSVDATFNPKPHPDIYLQAAAKLGVEPAACVVCEDSFVGIEAAKRAGMKCVGIASTFSAEDLCRETCADLVVSNFETLSLQTLRDLLQIKCPPPGGRSCR